MRNVPFFFVVLLFFCSCQKSEWIEIKDGEGKLVKKYQVDSDTELQNGLSESYSENGVLTIREQYRDGKLDGERIMFYSSGDTMLIENYSLGDFEGPYVYHYESGSLELIGQYHNNQMTGSWLRYYKNGQLMEKVMFVKNNENGPFIEYHENGNLKAKGAYLEGDNEHGLLELFDESGVLIKKMNCDHGICRTIWKKEKDEVIDDM